MIKAHVKGDLLEYFRSGKVDHMGHVCNLLGVMGAGIAHQIKNQYPRAYDAYKKFEDDYGLSPGSVSYGKVASLDLFPDDKKIFNLHAQPTLGAGVNIDYDALRDSLKLVEPMIKTGEVVGFPKFMGSALAGGDWNIVEKIIDETFEDRDVTVIIVEFSK